METRDIYTQLAEGQITPEELARLAAGEPAMVSQLVEGLQQSKAEVKYGCARALRYLVDDRPDTLYSYFDLFAGLLHSRNNILHWEAIYVLAGLASVDEDQKLPAIFPDYFAPVAGPNMITAANTIKGAAEIARGRPELAQTMLVESLGCEQGKYETDECYQIVCNTLLKSFYRVYKYLSDPAPLVEFAQRHRDNPRTLKAAEKLLDKYAKALA